MVDKFPEQVRLTPEEAYRVSRARLAIQLNKLPSEIDAAPQQDIIDLIAVYNADEEAKERARRKRK